MIGEFQRINNDSDRAIKTIVNASVNRNLNDIIDSYH